jgi:predicted phage gp36 major capsid-like protein
MEPADDVLARLDRIGELDRSGAPPAELLAELRGLLREAEAWTREGAKAEQRTASDRVDEAKEVVGRLRTALARDIIG